MALTHGQEMILQSMAMDKIQVGNEFARLSAADVQSHLSRINSLTTQISELKVENEKLLSDMRLARKNFSAGMDAMRQDFTHMKGHRDHWRSMVYELLHTANAYHFEMKDNARNMLDEAKKYERGETA